jgi:outer membrane biosynthesis protein TonB
MKHLAACLLALSLCACGNGANKPPPRTGGGDEPARPAPGPDDMGSVPAEKVEELNEYFTKKGVQVSRCYQEELQRRGERSLVGKVMVKMRLGTDGKASKVEVLETTLKTPAVEQCIVELIQAWNLPELPNAIVWTWTFEFQPKW